MNLLIGIFKKLQWLFSSPKRQQKAVFISETGVISLEILPMATGYISHAPSKMSWLVMHSLKGKLQGHDEPILRISERSYLPLDPFNRISDEEKKELTELDQIAKTRHAEARTNIIEKQDNNLISIMVWGFFILTGILLVLSRC